LNVISYGTTPEQKKSNMGKLGRKKGDSPLEQKKEDKGRDEASKLFFFGKDKKHEFKGDARDDFLERFRTGKETRQIGQNKG